MCPCWTASSVTPVSGTRPLTDQSLLCIRSLCWWDLGGQGLAALTGLTGVEPGYSLGGPPSPVEHRLTLYERRGSGRGSSPSTDREEGGAGTCQRLCILVLPQSRPPNLVRHCGVPSVSPLETMQRYRDMLESLGLFLGYLFRRGIGGSKGTTFTV